MDIPSELVEQFSRGNGVIFVGAGLSQGAGLPGWADLISNLTKEIVDCPSNANFYDVAQYYEIEKGRNRLVQKLREHFSTHTKNPTPAHKTIINLPASTIFTTNYDDLLEKTLKEEGLPYVLVVDDVEVGFLSADQKQLIKLHGDLNRPEFIVITSQDYEQFSLKRPALARLLATTLQTRTVLFLGYSATDFDLRLILTQVHSETGLLSRNLFIVQFNARQWTIKELERRGLKVIEISRDTGESITESMYAFLCELNNQIRRLRVDASNRRESVDDSLYRNWLLDRNNSIDIRGISIKGSQEAHRFPLLDLFIKLNVLIEDSESELDEFEHTEERTTLVDAVNNTRCTTILGDPGTGKTTFLRFLARTYVIDTNKPLPLLLRVTDFYNHVIDNRNGDGGSSRLNRSDWLVSYWLEQSQAFGWGFTEAWLTEQFELGKAVMLLDGLDELPTDEARIKMVRIIESASQRWLKCHWVLTSRPGVFWGEAVPLDFSTFVIAPLDDRDIHDFISAWGKLLFSSGSAEGSYGRQADEYIADLYRAIRERADVYRLARNPVMLTALAVVHWNDKKLPEGVAELYEAVIQWLIKARRELPNRKDAKATRRCYQLLALEMFQHPQGRQTQVGSLWAAEKIASYIDADTIETKSQAALQFLIQEEVNTGIIVRRGEGNIAFWHLSFQEYLAACEIASKTDDETTGWWSTIKDKLDVPEWAEVLRFVPIRLLTLGDARVDLFVKRVLDTRHNLSLLETARLVGFLIDIISDLTVYNYSITNVEEYVQARNKVMSLFTTEGLAIILRTRFDATIALGRSGDPRLSNPEKNWIRIPGGILWVGAQKDDPSGINYDEFAESEEQPVHQVYTASFEIGKYPVTVQDYAQFIKAGGYKNESLWEAASWEWRVNNNITSPENWDSQLPYPNCPVTYVCWYEAQAYCRWLTQNNKKMEYRLPTEAEWEYTARRGQATYSSYCFSNISPHDMKDEINWDSADLGYLAPVGMFPRDSTNDGVMDMSGNVREWTRDPGCFDYTLEAIRAGTIQEQLLPIRVVRGGSWDFIARTGRSASRTRVLPQYRYFDVGFRVMRTQGPIAIKGEKPTRKYRTTLADVFAKNMSTAFLYEDVNMYLSNYADRFPGLDASIIKELFSQTTGQENREFDRLPVMLGKAPPAKLDYNLLYQDIRLKLAVEEKLDIDCEQSIYEQDAQDLMEILSVLLLTKDHEHELWRNLTDNDFDALIFKILDIYNPNRVNRLLAQGFQTNEIALEGLESDKSIEELVNYQVFAGTVWWNNQRTSLRQQFPSPGVFAINDLNLLKQDLYNKDLHLIFIFDDNGELVWDLALIFHLLNENPRLRVTGVINTRVITNNANKHTLEKCLKHSKLRRLGMCDRFAIFEEDHYRSSIDLMYCSQALLNLLNSTDIAIVKGTAAFETMQNLPIDTYYAFVNHGFDVRNYTGLEEGKGVFVRIPKGKLGYNYGKQTLQEIYITLRQ